MTDTTVGRADDDLQEDGRRLRRERNRAALVEAMLELYKEGNLAPSSDEIAERAGLSPRSLFRHFEDLDDLMRAAVDRQLERLRPTWEIDFDATRPFAERVAALVDQRMRMFDAIGFVGVVSRMKAPFHPLVAAQLTQARSYLRNQIKRLFAPELAAMPSMRAASAAAAADVVTSFEAYQLLRHDQMLSRSRAAAVLATSLTSLLDPEDR